MEQILIDKIQELANNGATSVKQILQQLQTATPVPSTVYTSRPAYIYEAQMYSMLIPTIVTQSELISIPSNSRKSYITSKLLTMYNNTSSDTDKIEIVKTGLLISQISEGIESNGSIGFSDPFFLSPTTYTTIYLPGQNFLQENNLPTPTLDEIRSVLNN